jgi:hypothetical protein
MIRKICCVNETNKPEEGEEDGKKYNTIKAHEDELLMVTNEEMSQLEPYYLEALKEWFYSIRKRIMIIL